MGFCYSVRSRGTSEGTRDGILRKPQYNEPWDGRLILILILVVLVLIS